MKTRILFSIVGTLFLLNCTQSSTEEDNTVETPIEHPMPTTEYNSIAEGKKIAQQTGGVLMSNLTKAITAEGTEHALSFCSTRAIPLTDSMSIALNATIKRVSDKNRNPNNQANEKELAYMESAKAALAKGEQPQPLLTKSENKQVAYYPILTNPLCMQCHGQPETEVLPNTLAKIKELYPNDKAIGYALNELRGLWVVEME